MSPHTLRLLAGPVTRDETIPLGCSGTMAARVHQPPAGPATPDTPLVLHLHGGAFVRGDLETGAPSADLLAAAGGVAVSIDYPLAPASPFPAAIEASYLALLWLVRQRRRLAHARSPVVVSGVDAGANIAAGLAMVARDRGGPELAGQILLSPMLDACVATQSQRDARNGPVGCVCADGWRAYLSRPADALHPYAAPAQSQRQQGLPPALLLTAEDDPLRDETRAHAARLEQAGVPARLHVLPAPTRLPSAYRERLPQRLLQALREPIQSFFLSLR